MERKVFRMKNNVNPTPEKDKEAKEVKEALEKAEETLTEQAIAVDDLDKVNGGMRAFAS